MRNPSRSAPPYVQLELFAFPDSAPIYCRVCSTLLSERHYEIHNVCRACKPRHVCIVCEQFFATPFPGRSQRCPECVAGVKRAAKAKAPRCGVIVRPPGVGADLKALEELATQERPLFGRRQRRRDDAQ